MSEDAQRIARLEAMLAACEEAILVVDGRGEVVAQNRAAQQLARDRLPLLRVARGETFRELDWRPAGQRCYRLSAAPYGDGGILVVSAEEAALVDDLTGLVNRRGFVALAEQQMRLSDRNRRPHLVFFADLDDLKLINDAHGHDAGDAALREAAGLLRAAFRRSDVVGRIGGDEFAVVAIDAERPHGEMFSARIAALVGARNLAVGARFEIGLSTGYAIYEPDRPSSLDELLARADAAMYGQKRRHKAGDPEP